MKQIGIVKGFYTDANCVKQKYFDINNCPYFSFEIHVPNGDLSISIIGRGRSERSAWLRAYEFVNRRIIEKLEK